MKFWAKFFSFPLENLSGKLIFDHFLISRVPVPVGEFFAFNFFPFAVGGGFFRLVWNSGGLGGGFPPLPVSRYVWGCHCMKSNVIKRLFHATIMPILNPYPHPHHNDL